MRVVGAVVVGGSVVGVRVVGVKLVVEEVVDQAFIGGRQFAENGYGADHWAWIDGKTKFDWNNNWANGNKD